MQKLAVTLALITATFIANANSTAGYTTVIDKPIGDDIGWVHKIFVDDLNQDNNQDILIMFGGRRGVHYLGNGDGTLSEGTWFSGDYTPYADTLLADFNGDGRPDLFNKDFYPGSQDLSFAQRVTSTPDLRQCRKSLAMDFNSDGLIDVVCAVDDSVASRNDNSYGLFMHTNNGDLSFSLDIISLKNELTETRVETMAHGDIDNNGSEDIVQIVRSYSAIGAGARTESYKITSYPNQSHSTTPNYSPVATIDTMALHDVNNPWSGSSLQSMQLADTNNDGNLDVVALTGVNWTSVSPGFITVFHGNGDGTFTEQPVTTMLPSPYASAFKVTDLNADGKADLVVTFREDYTLSQQLGTQLAFGAGDSTFGPLQSLPAPQSNVWEVAAGDINSDGRLDILTLSGWNSGGRLVAFSE